MRKLKRRFIKGAGRTMMLESGNNRAREIWLKEQDAK